LCPLKLTPLPIAFLHGAPHVPLPHGLLGCGSAHALSSHALSSLALSSHALSSLSSLLALGGAGAAHLASLLHGAPGPAHAG